MLETLFQEVDYKSFRDSLVRYYRNRLGSGEDIEIPDSEIVPVLEMFAQSILDRDQIARWASVLEVHEDIFLDDKGWDVISYLSDVESGGMFKDLSNEVILKRARELLDADPK